MHVVLRGTGVTFRLVEAVPGGKGRLFRFEQRHCDRLSFRAHLNAKRVVHPPLGSAPRFAGDNLHCAGGLLPLNEILGPATRMNGRVNQLCSGVCFAEIVHSGTWGAAFDLLQ